MKKVISNILQNSQKNTCVETFFNKVTGLRLKARLLSCEFCEIIKNIYFVEHLRMTASELQAILKMFELLVILMKTV